METQDVLEFDVDHHAVREEPPLLEGPSDAPLLEQLAQFKEFGAATRLWQTQANLFSGPTVSVPTCVNEFWTSKQRAANSLHEVSYRACFKPQLPRFFIQRLTKQRELVYDPFM